MSMSWQRGVKTGMVLEWTLGKDLFELADFSAVGYLNMWRRIQ